MNVQIRKATLADAIQLAEILNQAMAYKQAHDDHAWDGIPYTAEELTTRIEAGKLYLVRLDQEVIGTFVLIWDDEMMWGPQPPVAGYIHQFAIKQAYHGQGLGKQIIEWAAQEVAHQGRQFLRLDFHPSNVGLRKYYESLGFTHVQDREVHSPNETFTSYTTALYERQV